jgi:hypothetical protein
VPEPQEPPLDHETVAVIIRMLMRIDAKLDGLLRLFEEDDDAEEEEPQS